MRARSFRFPAIAAAAAVATLLALELLFRCLPVSTATQSGYHFDPDIISYPGNHEWTFATGWDLRNVQHLRSNSMGFAATQEFKPDPNALVLVGDSYVESASVDAEQRPAAQLQRALNGNRPVYAMGAPGTALLDYAQRIRYAANKLQTRDFVVWLEMEDALQSLCGSGYIASRCLDPTTLMPRIERQAPSDGIKRFARHSALAQYVFGQLKFNPGKALAAFNSKAPSSGQRQMPDDARMQAVTDAVLNEFFAQIQGVVQGRIVFIIDGDRGTPPAHATAVVHARDYLLQQLRKRGAEVVDLNPVYAAHNATSRLSPEIGPYDRHLNALGVGLAMQAAASQLAH